MRVFTATLGTETNTFAPMPTGHAAYRATLWHEAGSPPQTPSLFVSPYFALKERADAHGIEIVTGLMTFAQPAGTTPREVYEGLRDRLLDDLRAALPVDIVLYALHGAMVAEGYEDCEGDLLARTRAIVGPDVVLGAELDLHCHLTSEMVDAADLLVLFKEYPHTDGLDRGRELVDLALRTRRAEIRPVMALHDCRMVKTYHTTREPMRGFVQSLKDAERKPGILSASFAHGFPWADVAEMGSRLLVVADGDRELARSMAAELAASLWRLRDDTHAPMMSHAAGIERALTARRTPVVLADTSDNPGGGAPGDSTFLLRALLERRADAVALGPLWDPIAVRFCHEAGAGARLPLRVGGKVGAVSGEPIDLEVEVLHLERGAMQSFAGMASPLGDTAAVRAAGVEILLCTHRTQGFAPDLFSNNGIALEGKRIVVVKSSQHFHAGFAPLAAEILYLDGAGALTQDFASLPYTKLRRPLWPIDHDNAAEVAA